MESAACDYLAAAAPRKLAGAAWRRWNRPRRRAGKRGRAYCQLTQVVWIYISAAVRNAGANPLGDSHQRYRSTLISMENCLKCRPESGLVI